MYVQWRDAGRWLLTTGAFFLPQPRRKAIDRWLRDREEHRKLQQADYVLMSWGKSGRTWLRVMLSRFYQIAYGVPEGRMLEFDNLKRLDPAMPSVFFTHGNYLRNYTGNWTDKREFYGKKIVMLVRDPRDVDLGLIFGVGFPPFKGGLLFWADTLGAAKIVEQLKQLESLGARAQPTAMLQDMAKTGRKFYSA